MRESPIIMPFPQRYQTKLPNVRVEVVDKQVTGEIIVHIFPKDTSPQNIQQLIKVCKALLLQRWPGVEGKAEIINVPEVAISACLTMPREQLDAGQDIEYLRTEFANTLASCLSPG